MNTKLFYQIFGVVVGGLSLLTLCGCEIGSADESVTINPDSATITKGQSVTLTASGGYVYRWSLAHDDWGILNTRSGNQVVYTSLYQPSGTLPASQIITVTSTFTENGNPGGGSDTNSASVSTGTAHSASAYITHMPDPNATSTNATL